MSMNRIQFQPGLSMPEFPEQFSAEAQCKAELEQARWPQGFVCPSCARTGHSVLKVGPHKTFQSQDCRHQTVITGGRKPKDVPEFLWPNPILGNLKTSRGGSYHAFDFAKYAARYLAAFAYRFNRRFLDTLQKRLLVATIAIGARSDAWLRSAEASC